MKDICSILIKEIQKFKAKRKKSKINLIDFQSFEIMCISFLISYTYLSVYCIKDSRMVFFPKASPIFFKDKSVYFLHRYIASCLG